MTDINDTFRLAADAFVDAVAGVGDDDWDKPGLGEWDVRSLVGHTTRALMTIETYLAAGTGPLDLTDPVDYYLAMLGDTSDTEPSAQLGPAIELTWGLLGRIASRQGRLADLVLSTTGRDLPLPLLP